MFAVPSWEGKRRTQPKDDAEKSYRSRYRARQGGCHRKLCDRRCGRGAGLHRTDIYGRPGYSRVRRGFARRESGLLLLSPIDKALGKMGYADRTGLGYQIEDWPVQFIPVGSALDEEALEQAVERNIAAPTESPLNARCLRAEHVVAIALNVGRLKDLARIQAFLDQDAVDLVKLKAVLERHHMIGAWQEFCVKAAIRNPF